MRNLHPRFIHLKVLGPKSNRRNIGDPLGSLIRAAGLLLLASLRLVRSIWATCTTIPLVHAAYVPHNEGKPHAHALTSTVIFNGTTVSKIYAPGLVPRVIYWLAFQAEFPYMRNQAALQAAVLRRNLAGKLTEYWYGTNRVARAIGIDEVEGHYSLTSAFIPGGPPINRHAAHDFLFDLANKFDAVGLPTWQVDPRQPRAMDNILETSDGEFHIIDLESGLVSPLASPRAWWRAFERGLVPIYDDVYFDLTRSYLEREEAAMRSAKGDRWVEELRSMLDQAEVQTQAWHRSEPRLWSRIVSGINQMLSQRTRPKSTLTADRDPAKDGGAGPPVESASRHAATSARTERASQERAIFSLVSSPKRLITILLAIASALFAVDLLMQAIDAWRAPGFLGWSYIMRIFDLDAEQSLGTWYQIASLIVLSAVLTIIAVTKWRMGDRYTLHWFILAALSLGLSIDEQAKLHDPGGLSNQLRGQLPLHGLLYTGWVVFGLISVLVVALFFLKFALDLPSSTLRWFAFAALLFVSGELLFEMVSGWYLDGADSENFVYQTITSFEEYLGMVGVLVATTASLAYVRDFLGGLRLEIGADKVSAERGDALRASEQIGHDQITSETATKRGVKVAPNAQPQVESGHGQSLHIPFRRQPRETEEERQTRAARWLEGSITSWQRDGRITAGEATKLREELQEPQFVAVLPHFGVHLAIGVALRFPIGSILRASYTLFNLLLATFRLLARNIDRHQWRQAFGIHSPLVILIAGMPGIGTFAYLASKPFRAHHLLLRVAVDMVLMKFPRHVYERTGLRWIIARPTKAEAASLRARAAPLGLTVWSQNIVLILGLALGALFAADLVSQFANELGFVDPQMAGWRQLSRMLDLGTEQSFGTWYSVVLLAFLSALLAVITYAKHQQHDRFSRHWFLLTLLTLAFSIDEQARMHNPGGGTGTLREDLSRHGPIFYDWVIIGLVSVFIVAFFYRRFVMSLSETTSRLFMLAAALYIGGELVLSSLAGWYFDSVGNADLIYQTITSVGEFFGMAGIFVAIAALLDYMQRHFGEVHIALSDHVIAEGRAEGRLRDARTPTVRTTQQTGGLAQSPAAAATSASVYAAKPTDQGLTSGVSDDHETAEHAGMALRQRF